VSAIDKELAKVRAKIGAMAASPPTEERLRAQLATMRHQLIELQEENLTLGYKLNEANHRIAHLTAAHPSGGRSPSWVRTYLMFLIKACHPDKHGNNEEATEVTKQLLKLREE